jgi:type I site-specific restriction endonuclease
VLDAANSGSLSERRTRRDLIDPKLKAAGWKVVPFKEGKTLDAVPAEWQQSSAELRKSMEGLFETLETSRSKGST